MIPPYSSAPIVFVRAPRCNFLPRCSYTTWCAPRGCFDTHGLHVATGQHLMSDRPLPPRVSGLFACWRAASQGWVSSPTCRAPRTGPRYGLAICMVWLPFRVAAISPYLEYLMSSIAAYFSTSAGTRALPVACIHPPCGAQDGLPWRGSAQWPPTPGFAPALWIATVRHSVNFPPAMSGSSIGSLGVGCAATRVR